VEGRFCELRLDGVLGSSLAARKKVRKKTPTPTKFIADSSPIGKIEGAYAYPCLARRANPLRGGDVKVEM
jgi:hypothetical protein